MRRIMFLTLITLVFLNLTAIPANAEGEKLDKDLIKVINNFIPTNSSLISSEQPVSTEPFQLYDFNHDGNKEIIINYKIQAKKQPSPSQFGAIILKKENNKWKKSWETKAQGVGLNYSGLADITGDGIKEYLFGVTIGAAAGNKLEIFKWKNNSLNMIADVPYHMMELLRNKDVEIAFWQRYIADTYFVDVLKWNGKKLVLDEEAYSDYYPVIEKFHKDKLSKMDAWFYWYTFADAQIKANLFDKAKKSIQIGTSLAKKLSLDDVVENFNQLKMKLENKKKSN